LDRATLSALLNPLRNFEYVFRNEMSDLTGTVSDAPALERIRLISLEVQKEKSLSGARGHLHDAGASSPSSGAGAREVNVLAAQNEAELALILGTDNTQAGQVEATKLALRTGNQFIFHAIVKVATPSEISVYPVLAKVHTVVKAQLPTVGAQELLKSAGAVSNAALTRLSSALPVGTLISVLKGNLPSVATLAEFYSAYSSAISMGQQVIRFSPEFRKWHRQLFNLCDVHCYILRGSRPHCVAAL